MKRHLSVLLAGFVFVCGMPAAAQQPRAATPAPARAAAPPAPPAAPAPPPAPGAPYIDLAAGGQSVNIRLEVSINDQAGPTPAQPKVLTLLLADRNNSQLRSNFEDRAIRMDARPTIVDGKIKLTLTMESSVYTIGGPFGQQISDAQKAARITLNWNQSMTVIVENGKPLVVIENSDPANNRKLSVEVKATILK